MACQDRLAPRYLRSVIMARLPAYEISASTAGDHIPAQIPRGKPVLTRHKTQDTGGGPPSRAPMKNRAFLTSPGFSGCRRLRGGSGSNQPPECYGMRACPTCPPGRTPPFAASVWTKLIINCHSVIEGPAGNCVVELVGLYQQSGAFFICYVNHRTMEQVAISIVGRAQMPSSSLT